MILAVSGLYFNKKVHRQTGRQTDTLTIAKSLNNDTFELKQKSIPSFSGGIPHRQIKKCCAKALKKARNASSIKGMDTIASIFFRKIRGLLVDIRNKNNEDFYYCYHHEIGNSIQTLSFKVANRRDAKPKKETLINAVNYVRECTAKWVELEVWKDPNITVPFEGVFAKLKKIAPDENFSVEGLELLKNKKVKDPFQLYAYISQLFLNAVKYGDGKPFEIKFEKVLEKSGKEVYYMSVTNSTKTPVTDIEIGKILQGSRYRSEAAKKSVIPGTGKGFQEIVEILRRNEQDVSNLIKIGPNGEFCVEVPLVGICD